MTSCAFDGRLLATDSISHHNAQTTTQPPFFKVLSHETKDGAYALFGAGDVALINRIARQTFGCLKPENADLCSVLDGYNRDSKADCGLIKLGEQPQCWIMECGGWHPSSTKTAAWGNNWEWAVCRMVTAGDDAGQAVQSVIDHHYGCRGPVCVLDCVTGERSVR